MIDRMGVVINNAYLLLSFLASCILIALLSYPQLFLAPHGVFSIILYVAFELVGLFEDYDFAELLWDQLSYKC